MAHAVYSRDLGRNAGARRALVRGLARSLLWNGRITTTHARAKETQRLVERLVTLGKRGTLSTRRQAIRLLDDRQAVHRLFADIAPRFTDRKGGYTRILHRGSRRGDGADLSVLEWVVQAQAAPAAESAEAAPRRRWELRRRPKPSAALRQEKKVKPEEPKPQDRPAPGPEESVAPTAPPPKPPPSAEKPKVEKPPLPEKKPRGFLDHLRRFFKDRDKK